MLLERSNSTRAPPSIQLQNEQAPWGFALALYDQVVIRAWWAWEGVVEYMWPTKRGKEYYYEQDRHEAEAQTVMNEDEREAFKTAGI